MRTIMVKFIALPLFGIMVALAAGQSTDPRQAPQAAKEQSSPVDSVIELVKSGMSEDLIIKTLRKQNKPIDLLPADLVKLKNAGVSESLINAMMDPARTPVSPAAPPASTPIAEAPTAQSAAPQPAVGTTGIPSSNPSSGAVAQKKRVIVDEFDYSTVTTAVQAVFGTQQNIGKGIRAMLTDRLTQLGKVVVVERAKIDTLLKEQDRNIGGRVKQGSGAQVGRISGADGLLTGDIIVFGRDDKKMKARGGGIFGGAIGAIGAMKSEDKAVVAISYRLVDAETSEVIATGEARGESVRKSKGIAGIAGALGKGGAGVEVDMTTANFAETIIGEATIDCVNKLAAILNTQAEAMKRQTRAVEAYVADVSGNMLVISAGSNDGVNVGEVFEIHKIVREVRDPVTKEVLDTITEKVGEMTVTSVRDKIATGTYVGSPAQVGFAARKKL